MPKSKVKKSSRKSPRSTKSSVFEVNKNFAFLLGGCAVIIGLGIFSLLMNYFAFLRTAHSSFQNYYNFRGCQQLISKTDQYGYCKLADGKVIKLVYYNNKWYLDGDLPICIGKICF